MNIIITGASRGIGYHIVKNLIADNTTSNKVFAISRNIDELKSLATKHNNLIPVKCNINSETEIERLNSIVKTHVDHIDILVNNAAAIVNKEFTQITGDEIDYVFSANFKAPFMMIKQFLPMLKAKSTAHVINISSMGGFQGAQKFPGLSVYSSSKAALSCLTECLAEELKHTGISINALCIGAVQTEMLSEAFPGYVAPVTAVQMADFICNFAFKSHKMMNGKIIPVALSTP
ncbi:MAG: SDR family oxidoreductase [Bacteroidota bacterium]